MKVDKVQRFSYKEEDSYQISMNGRILGVLYHWRNIPNHSVKWWSYTWEGALEFAEFDTEDKAIGYLIDKANECHVPQD